MCWKEVMLAHLPRAGLRHENDSMCWRFADFSRMRQIDISTNT